jgi:MFS family permease
MRPDLVIPAILLAVAVGVAFVIGRARTRDFEPRRDLVVLLAIVAMGAIGVGVVLAPAPVSLLAVPLLLVVGGAYINRHSGDFRDTGWNSKRPARWLGVGAVIVGIAGFVLGVVRLAS